MNKLSQLLLVMLLVCSLPVFAGGDNTVTIAGKSYTLHVVKAGETLYSIAQSTGVDVAELKKVNRMDAPNAAVKADDVVIIPIYAKATKTAAPAKEKETSKVAAKESSKTTTGGTTHTVKAHEGLYAIARQYHTTAIAIRAANGLTSDVLTEGQVLKIPTDEKKTATPEKTTTPVAATKSTTTATPATTKTTATATPIATPTKSATPPTVKTATPAVDENIEGKLDMKMMNQLKATFDSESRGKGTVEAARGVGAQMQESAEGQSKFYALSKTAPVGKVLKIRNIMNSRVTYVKVIGKLPDNSDNQNVMVKVSGAAAKYLKVLDPKFQCEVTEYK